MSDIVETKKSFDRKKILLAVFMFLLTGGAVTGVYFGKKSSETKAEKERTNTLRLINTYMEKGLYDQALDLLNGLIIKNADDAEALELLAVAAEHKKNSIQGNSENSYSFSQATTDISEAVQYSIDSMKEQLAQQSAENERNVKTMNELLKQQAVQNQTNIQAMEEQRTRQEAEAKKKEQEEAEKKKREEAERKKQEELEKKNAEYQALADKINYYLSQAKAALNSGNAEEAFTNIDNAARLIPSGSSAEDKKLAAKTNASIAEMLYDAAQNTIDDKEQNEKAKKKAVQYANASISINTHDGMSHYILGMNFQEKKKYPEAEKEFKLAIQEKNDNYLYYYQLGRTQALQKKYSEARVSFTSSIKYNSNFKEAQYNLGYVNERLNKAGEALQAYRKAYAIDSQYENAYLQAAKILAKQNDYQGAIKLFQTAVTINSSNPSTYKQLGSAYSALKDFKNAEESYRKALKLLPKNQNDPVTYYNLSTVLFNQNKYSDALDFAKQAYVFRMDADKGIQASIIYNYALIAEKTDNIELAVKLYNEVIATDNKNIKAKTNLAAICLEQGSPETALKLLENALKQDSENFEINNGLGNAHLANKNYDEAINYFLKANKIDPKSTIAVSNLAKAYAGGQKYEEAKKCYLDMIKNDKQNYDAYIDLARVCIAQKDYSTGEGYLLYVQSKDGNLRKDEVEELLDSIKNAAK